MDNSVGVIIGRFQVPHLHEGHIGILSHVVSKHERVVVFVGVAHHLSKRNPLPFPVVRQMVAELLTQYDNRSGARFMVLPLFDRPSNEEWSDQIDDTLKTVFPGQTFKLYCGRDSFQSCYIGKNQVIEVKTADCPCGTEERAKVAAQPLFGIDTRRGMIASQELSFPRVNPCVDIAILRSYPDGPKVLMARKRSESTPEGYRFIGGYVDPSDASLESAAKREAGEETGLETDNYRYVTSTTIEDWRYRNTPDTVMSAFFVADYIFGAPTPRDDIHQLVWVPISNIYRETLALHTKLAEYLLEYVENNNLGGK